MESFFILKNVAKPKKIIAVKNGFSFNLFLLGPIMGAFKGLWMEVLISIVLINLTLNFAPEFTVFTLLISSIFWGFFGKDLYIQKLLKQSYTPEDIVTCKSSEKAILIFSSQNK